MHLRIGHIVGLIACVSLCLHESAVAQRARPLTFTSLGDLVRAFGEDSVPAGARVDLVATLTYADQGWDTVFVQDGDAGMYVLIRWSSSDLRNAVPGSRVRLRGDARPGSNRIENCIATFTSPGRLPEPRAVTISELSEWESASLYVSSTGIVEQIALLTGPPQTLLTLRAGSTRFLVRFPGVLDRQLVSNLAGAEIEVRGVLGAQVDALNNPKYHLIYVSDTWQIKVLRNRVKARQFTRLTPAMTRHRANGDASLPQRVRFRGQLTELPAEPEVIVLHDGETRITVRSAAWKYLRARSPVDVSGRLTRSEDGLLIEPEFLVAGHVVPMSSTELSGADTAPPAVRHMSVTGILERISRKDADRCELYIREGDLLFVAVLTASEQQLADLSIGDRIACSGPVHFEDEADVQFTVFTSPSDLTWSSTAPPSEDTVVPKTPSNLLAGVALAGLGFLSLALFVWYKRQDHDASRQRLHAAPVTSSLDSISDGLLIFDAEGRLVVANQPLTRMFHITCQSGDTSATVLDSLSATLDDPVFRVSWTEAAKDPSSTACVDLEIKGRNDRRYHVVSSPIRNGGEDVSGRLWRFNDTTEREMLEQRLVQSQKMDAVGRLAGGIAHEFNNLLMGITTNLAVCREQSSAETIEYIDATEKAAERAGDLVSNLLGFSRKSPLQRSVCSANTLVERAEAFLRRVFEPSIRIDVSLSPQPCECALDETQIEQVLINLCINARDALPNIGGRIRLSTQVGDAAPERCVVISVEDNGHGMSDEVRSRVFEPFFTTKEPGKGTGLGLAMSYGIVEAHGGQIECSSSVGRGTRFEVVLPLHAGSVDPGSEVKPAETDRPEPIRAGSHSHILLADDEEVVRRAVESLLVSRGYSVTAVPTGAEAIDALAEGLHADVAIIDQVMPGLSGRQVFETLSDRHPTLPVIVLSGRMDELNTFRATNGRTPSAILTKPCQPDRLIAVLEHVRQQVVN